MRILLTGGCGDLGLVLSPKLQARGDNVVLLDVRQPDSRFQYHENSMTKNDKSDEKKSTLGTIEFVRGSILERENLPGWFFGCDAIVHIAAWHGIHEFKKEKDAYDFFDLNVRGTFEVFEAAIHAGVERVILISSTSIDEPNTVYGNSKIVSEQIASFYANHHKMRVVTLRPRAFIPHWNRSTYNDYIEWAQWFWKGAVHIDDVAEAIVRSLDFLAIIRTNENFIVTVDGAYEYSEYDLKHWDADGPGSTFNRYFEKYSDLAISHGLDPAKKPKRLDASDTARKIGYNPKYSLRNLLQDLAVYGEDGPPPPWLQ